MKTIGFPISDKENEKRRAIIPKHIKLLDHPEQIYIEDGYGKVIGIYNNEYADLGCKICTHEEAISKDIVCDPKIGDATCLDKLKDGATIFGWVHATQNRDITDTLISKKLTAYAWEKMFEGNRHVFWRNNELAGEAAIIHAFQCYGCMPYDTKVAVIGRGNTARGAMKILNMLGADVMQYDRHTERMLVDELDRYDVVVNCVLWDVMRTDHIISRADLKKMKPNSLIIDISCDRHGGIETSVPTTIDDPIYEVDGIVHYAVDHTPALFWKTFTENNSSMLYKYIEQLIMGKPDNVLQKALIIDRGVIVDEEINKFQHRV